METAVAQTPSWADARAALATPFFAGISALIAPFTDWPTHAELNALARARNARNAAGIALQFVPVAADAGGAMAYEQRIAATGQIPTRSNWHDVLNALQWLAMPRLKAAINAQHVNEIERQLATGSAQRSITRDVLTMIDESGVLVASHDQSLLDCIRGFRWHELFVDRRADAITNMRCVLIGHGLLEKSLNPFIGLTAKAILLHFDMPAGDNGLLDVDFDALATDWLHSPTNVAGPRCLAPLPLLGIPGWWAANGDATFYDNTNYFRRGYRAAER